MKVFISWSGDRSLHIAAAMRDWLVDVAHSVEPFMSDVDIEKGKKGSVIIDQQLEESDCGVLCLTPENLKAPWISYEAGALAKAVKKSNIWTFLYGVSVDEIRRANVPFGDFQHTIPQEADVRKLVRSIHERAKSKLPQSKIDKLVSDNWPTLAEKLRTVPPPGPSSVTTLEQMVADLHNQIVGRGLSFSLSTSLPIVTKEPNIKVSGTYKGTLRDGQIIVPIVQNGREFRPNRWCYASDGKWKSHEIWFNGTGRQIIHITAPVDAGRKLVEYYGNVNGWIKDNLKVPNKWVPITMDRLPPELEPVLTFETNRG